MYNNLLTIDLRESCFNLVDVCPNLATNMAGSMSQDSYKQIIVTNTNTIKRRVGGGELASNKALIDGTDIIGIKVSMTKSHNAICLDVKKPIIIGPGLRVTSKLI